MKYFLPFAAILSALFFVSCESEVAEPEPPATDLPVPGSAADVPADADDDATDGDETE